MLELDAVIHGRVQLVMFRDFARRNALDLSLRGFVENRSDGSVHVVAQGEVGALSEYLERLGNGPVFAKVEGIEHSLKPAETPFDGFHIRY